MKNLKAYAIALSGLMAIILVFGITLTSGSSEDRKRNDLEIADLKNQLVVLEDRMNTLEESNKAKTKEINSLKKVINKIESQDGSLVPVTNLFTPIATDEPKSSTKQSEIFSSKSVPKKYYTFLEIAGFASYKVEYQSGQTALDQLVKSAKENNFEIKYTKYDFGIFVDCIGGICGNANHFWALYENGEMSMVGAADLVLEINDKINWVYTSF